MFYRYFGGIALNQTRKLRSLSIFHVKLTFELDQVFLRVEICIPGIWLGLLTVSVFLVNSRVFLG